MAAKIGLSDLIARVAIATGKKQEICEKFIREFAATVSQQLSEGDNVKIKGLGTFKLVRVEVRKSVNISTGEEYEIPAHNKIIFVPTAEIASKVNKAFEPFDTLEIDEAFNGLPEDDPEENEPDLDGGEPDMADEIYELEAFMDEELKEGEEEVVTGDSFEFQSEGEELDDMATSEAYLYNIDEALENDKEREDSHAFEEDDISEPTEEQKIENREEEEKEKELQERLEEENRETVRSIEREERFIARQAGSRGFGMGFLWGIICALIVCGALFVIGFYVGWFNNGYAPVVTQNISTGEKEINAQPATVTDQPYEEEILEEENEPEPPSPVYDTVTKTRYLTTIAQEHYGNFNFWPYIYEENSDILGHPDRIKPGTQVVVPPLLKYGVDVQNRQDIETAKKKGYQIYARYR